MALHASAATTAIMNPFWPSPARPAPSAPSKRSAVFAEWGCDEVLEPVTHRHYVFSIPKILHKVFRMLLKEGLITEERVKMILSWMHTEFHVHNEGRVVANDTEGRERLAKHLIRPPVSLERLTYDRKNQQVFYHGKTGTYTPLLC